MTRARSRGRSLRRWGDDLAALDDPPCWRLSWGRRPPPCSKAGLPRHKALGLGLLTDLSTPAPELTADDPLLPGQPPTPTGFTVSPGLGIWVMHLPWNYSRAVEV